MSDLNTGPMETVPNDRDDLVSLDKDRTKQDKKLEKGFGKMEKKADELAQDAKGADLNPDPLTGAPGAHPVGTGVGAAAGAAAGAVGGGLVAGPLGFAAGGVVGAVVGGLSGKGVAEKVDPTVEDKYWRDNFSKRSYTKPGTKYEQLQPAYKYGWEARKEHEGKEWNDVETQLEAGWTQDRERKGLSWNDAKHATKDAWQRLTDEK